MVDPIMSDHMANLMLRLKHQLHLMSVVVTHDLDLMRKVADKVVAPGFHATAGTAGTTFHAWVETAPTADSVSPSSGSGLSQQFTWKASSPSGYSNLSEMFALFNTSVSGQNACYIRYNRISNLLYLADNSAAYWLGGFVPGNSGTTGNSQCSIDASGSSASGSGTQLTLTVSVTFQTSFSGTKNDYLFAQDNAGLNSRWQQVGTWTVPAPQQYYLTTAVSPSGGATISPTSGWYNSGTVVSVSATANSGYKFTGFTGDLSGTTTPQNLTMNAPKSVTANFTGSTVQHVITSAPVGRSLTVDGAPCTAPCTFYWTPGTSHTIATTTAQAGGSGTQYVFASWSDGGAISHTITASSSAATYTASFTTQYYLTTSASPPAGGTISPASGWYNSGAVATVAATCWPWATTATAPGASSTPPSRGGPGPPFSTPSTGGWAAPTAIASRASGSPQTAAPSGLSSPAVPTTAPTTTPSACAS